MSNLCCFQVIALNKKQSLIHVSCSGIAQPNGYCPDHQYAAHLLDKARFYGCPEIEPPVNTKSREREGLIIRQGLDNWQAYCCVVSREHAREMEQRLEREHGQMFKKVGVA